MSTYRIEPRPAAIRALRKVHPEDKERIQGAIALLGQDPRPPKQSP
jgi:mRNA interferase RelE/StbE